MKSHGKNKLFFSTSLSKINLNLTALVWMRRKGSSAFYCEGVVGSLMPYRICTCTRNEVNKLSFVCIVVMMLDTDAKGFHAAFESTTTISGKTLWGAGVSRGIKKPAASVKRFTLTAMKR
jgi:hypothetical protein